MAARKAAKKKRPSGTAYERKKERASARTRQISQTHREIGPLPAVVDPERRARCLASLRVYCETYHPNKFFLGWSADHLEAIAILERCILGGGLFALAMPRGSGKTELSKRAVEWAILGGHRRFVMLIGAASDLAVKMMADIKSTFENNPGIGDDFPEVCWPIRRLEGINNRTAGQTLEGKRTRIIWKENELRFPAVEGSLASGAAIWTRGIDGSVRGANTTSADGGSMRPDFCIPDDVQTRLSAKSLPMTAEREATIDGDILKLAGPGQRIAAVMPCTVIYTDDLSDRYLDPTRHPEWESRRFKALINFPSDISLWQEYAAIRREGQTTGSGSREANAFYAARRQAMDAGAVVAWDGLQQSGDLSALQTCMNLFFDNPATFWAEWQNTPEARHNTGELSQLEPAAISRRLTAIPRLTVPRTCTRLTSFIDVQANILYYLVAAWDERFGGSIVDYGAFPRQNQAYFAASDARPGLIDLFPGLEEAARIYAGLRLLTEQILGPTYRREDSLGDMRVERCLIDSGYATDTIYQFCRQSAFASLLTPTKGFGLGASKLAMAEWPKKEGERRGPGWIISTPEAGRGRSVKIDTYTWKSFVAERLRSADGTPGAIRIFGDRPFDHQLLADHLTSEFRIPTEGRGRKLEEWKVRPDRRENHWWDCLVGCAVAASILGLRWDAAGALGEPARPTQAKPKTHREMWEEAQRRKSPR